MVAVQVADLAAADAEAELAAAAVAGHEVTSSVMSRLALRVSVVMHDTAIATTAASPPAARSPTF